MRNRQRGIYTEPDRVRRIRHEGRHYRLDALPLWEPSPQRTPVLYKAGASDRGRVFAALHTECMFVYGGDMWATARLVADLRQRASPRPILAASVTGRTEAEARDRLEEYRRHASVEGVLAHASVSMGVDFGRFGMDEPIDVSGSQAIQSNVDTLAAVLGPGCTKRQFVDNAILGGRMPPFVGPPSRVADLMQRWITEVDVDGFNLPRTVMPECLEAFIDLVVPELQARGLSKTEYAMGSNRHKLFGRGDQLAEDHPAAVERWPASAPLPA